MNELFHTLRMDGNTKIYISNHLSTINGIVSELEAIGVKIDDEDTAFKLEIMLSLPCSFEYMKYVLMYGKETEFLCGC